MKKVIDRWVSPGSLVSFHSPTNFRRTGDSKVRETEFMDDGAFWKRRQSSANTVFCFAQIQCQFECMKREREKSSNSGFCQWVSISVIGPGHLVVWIADLQLFSGDCVVCTSKSLERKVEVKGPTSATLNSLSMSL